MDYKTLLSGLAAAVVGSCVVTFIAEKYGVFGRRALGVFAIVGMIALVVFVPTWRLKLLFILWFLFAVVGSLWREQKRRTKLANTEVNHAD